MFISLKNLTATTAHFLTYHLANIVSRKTHPHPVTFDHLRLSEIHSSTPPGPRRDNFRHRNEQPEVAYPPLGHSRSRGQHPQRSELVQWIRLPPYLGSRVPRESSGTSAEDAASSRDKGRKPSDQGRTSTGCATRGTRASTETR